MKFKLTVVSLALLFANNVMAADLPAYYTIEAVKADQGEFGPYPVAMSEDGLIIATYSTKASLSSNIDIGLPFTFNRECQYDYMLCDLEFYGSENSAQLSYYNAYQKWRNAQSDAQYGNYESYMMASTVFNGTVVDEDPFSNGNGTSDVKTTDVTDVINNDRFVVGYGSAPYEGGTREFTRRGYIKSASGGVVTSLLPEAFTLENGTSDQGGFSSAYKMQQVTVGGEAKTFVIGAASRSFPRNSTEYFDDCYNSDQYDERYGINELVRCPGFDTQAWAWDVTNLVEGEDQTGFPLATHWLENNDTGGRSLTFSANAFDINETGLAVGASTFEYNNNSEGGRQRAIIMTPADDGSYGKPEELFAVTNDIEDQEDWIYNTWALTVSNAGLITGNREYNTSKGRNKPIEFFVYDNVNKTIKFPLIDKKVATTKQYNESGSQYVGKSGANSRVYDANEEGWMVGEIDDYDQLDPVYQASSRSQTGFLFNNETDEAWLMNDLLCTQNAEGVVTSPLIRIRSARVINDAGVVLAEGFEYASQDEYRYKTNGVRTTFRLTPNPAVASPTDSPNCWESSLLDTVDEPYERSGAATFWLWLFALPLMFIRRFKR